MSLKSMSAQGKSWGTNSTQVEYRYTAGLRALDEARRLNPDLVHVVHYEELLDRPREILRKAFDFVGLKWNDSYITLDEFNRKAAALEPNWRPVHPLRTTTNLSH